jgi:hypothetical protein
MCIPPRHFGELLSVAVLDDVGNVIIKSAGREGVADRKKRIHAIRGLVDLGTIGGAIIPGYPYVFIYGKTDLVVLVTPRMILPHAQYKVQNRYKSANGVGISA